MLYDRYGHGTADTQPPAPQLPPATTAPTTPEALYTLFYMVGDHQFVDQLVRSFTTWEEMAAAGPMGLAYAAGPWAAQLRIPAQPQQMPAMPQGVRVHSRYEDGYPERLTNLDDAPGLLYYLGDIPTRPMLAIGGTYYPSQVGTDTIHAAVRAAVTHQIPIVAALDSGCGHMALQEAVSLGGKVLAVSSCDLGNPASNAWLFQRILDNGGGIISEWGPREQWREDRTFTSARIVAALGAAVVLAELGTHPTGGAHLARAAITSGQYLIVPAPADGVRLPVGRDGVETLARPRSFTDQPFGAHPRITARVAAGKPAADAVVNSPEELAQAIITACGTLPSAG